MSLANLEFDNFTAIHSAIRKMNSFDKDTWVTIDLEKGETGAYILPSPDAHINLLNENIRNSASFLRNFAPEAGIGGEIGIRINY